MVVLTGADVVLPEGVRSGGTIVIDGDRIVDLTATARPSSAGEQHFDVRDHLVVPGFIDVHVHGIEGIDSLAGPDAVASMAGRLTKYGVTAFCPTTVACDPQTLRQMLNSVAYTRTMASAHGARVLPAHLESNFINPAYRGAQPEHCLRTPPAPGIPRVPRHGGFDGTDILEEIDKAGDAVGIVTLAPELAAADDLIRHLVARHRRVALGHSAATLEQGRAAISAGACHATHLFNRMPPLGHRDPGLVGAVLESDAIAAEIICDGVHVHPAMVHLSIAMKHAERVMAITDGTAAAGLPPGSAAKLGPSRITVTKSAAYLEDGTLAGSIATMDAVFRFLVREVKLSPAIASQLCSTTQADELGLRDIGRIVTGNVADLVVLDRNLRVKHTFVAGRLVYSAS